MFIIASSLFSTLKVEAMCSSAVSVPTYQTAQCYNPEDHSMNLDVYWYKLHYFNLS
jgi:hypothetical protein